MEEKRNSLLNDYLSIKVRVIPELQMQGELWRANISIFDEKRNEKASFGKNGADVYELWATSEYLEDFAKVENSERGMEKFAKQYIKKRFDEAINESGDRTLERIEESCATCYSGTCIRGKRWDFSEHLKDQ